MSSHGTGGRREAFKSGGLQLSRSTRGIQNTRRSVRHLGATETETGPGSGRHVGRSHSDSGDGRRGLGSDLAKIGRRAGKRPPTLSDDISIDDSVMSEAEKKRQQQKSASSTGRRSRSLSESGEDKGDSNNPRAKQITRRDSFRLPPRKYTFDAPVNIKRGGGQIPLSRSDRSRSPVPSSARSKNINSTLNDLSRSEHGSSSTAAASGAIKGIKNLNLDLSRSEHGTSNTTSAGAASGAVKGIKNLIGSMDTSSHANKPLGGGRDRSMSPPPQPRARQLVRDGNHGSTSLHGIYNLLDGPMKDASLKDRSLNDNSMKDRSLKAGTMEDRSVEDDGTAAAAAAVEDGLGANRRRSIQGIYKLLGSMRDVKGDLSAEEEEQQQAKEKSHTPRPVRSPRQMQEGNKAALGRLGNRSKQQDDSSCSSSSDEEAARVKKAPDALPSGAPFRKNRVRGDWKDSRRRVMAASKMEDATPPLQAKGTKDITRNDKSDDENVGLVAAATPDDSDDGDDANDFDTVTTPKTVAEPQAPSKEAPPPPQRKTAIRRNRNPLPFLEPQQNSTGSRQSAPAKIPSTPTKSPSGFVIEMGPGDVAATPVSVKHGTVQDANAMMTPVATPVATMPVVPRNDPDSVATPRTVPGTPAPKDLVAAPPPPPKRNADAAQRWKERAKNRLPVMPGPTTPTFNRPFAGGARAPTMSMLSPGGIVIEVNPATHSHMLKKSIREPMTPTSMAGELTPGNHSGSPYFRSLRTPTGTSRRGQIPNTPSMHSTSGLISELSDGSYPSVPSTPSVQSNSGDISELTPGTLMGRMTPRQTPRGGHVPGTPSYYNSPAGLISELTPGGFSVGLLGDDEDDQGYHLKTPSASFHSRAGVISEMTPTNYGIILEESDSSQEESLPRNARSHAPVPSTPSLHSPAGVVSELTPRSHGINMLEGLSGHENPTNIPRGSWPITETPSVVSSAGSNMSELTPGTYGIGKGYIPSTPSLYSPAGVVSEESPGNSSNPSFHSESASGVLSELTPGTAYGTGLLKDSQGNSSNSSSGKVPILG